MAEYAFIVYYRADQDYGDSKTHANRNLNNADKVWRFKDMRSSTFGISPTVQTVEPTGSGNQDVFLSLFGENTGIVTTMAKSLEGDPDYDATYPHKNYPLYKARGDPDDPTSGFGQFVRAQDETLYVLRCYYNKESGNGSSVATDEYMEFIGSISDISITGQGSANLTKLDVDFTFNEDTLL